MTHRSSGHVTDSMEVEIFLTVIQTLDDPVRFGVSLEHKESCHVALVVVGECLVSSCSNNQIQCLVEINLYNMAALHKNIMTRHHKTYSRNWTFYNSMLCEKWNPKPT